MEEAGTREEGSMEEEAGSIEEEEASPAGASDRGREAPFHLLKATVVT